MKVCDLSIIIPVFNGKHLIGDCLESVIAQTLQPKEVIVMDSCSTDGTTELVASYSKQHPFIRLVCEKDKGIYDAMNRGLDLASGEWIFFLGCDDRLFSPTVLSSLYELQRGSFSWADFVYGNVLLGNSTECYAGEFSRTRLLVQNICHQAIFTRKKLFAACGNFDTRYKALADWKFNLSVFFRPGVKIAYVPVVISRYSNEGMSRTAEDPFMKEKEAFVGALLSRLPLFERLEVKVHAAALPGDKAMFSKSRWRIFLYSMMLFAKGMRDGYFPKKPL
jgi:glycosyltransferase involved in cell wall biosynthesis